MKTSKYFFTELVGLFFVETLSIRKEHVYENCDVYSYLADCFTENFHLILNSSEMSISRKKLNVTTDFHKAFFVTVFRHLFYEPILKTRVKFFVALISQFIHDVFLVKEYMFHTDLMLNVSKSQEFEYFSKVISFNPERTSSKVKATSVAKLISQPNLLATASNQPILLGLPVLAPYSLPFSLMCSAISENISVQNGPSPTHVEYDFITPNILLMECGGIGAPTEAKPGLGEDEVV